MQQYAAVYSTGNTFVWGSSEVIAGFALHCTVLTVQKSIIFKYLMIYECAAFTDTHFSVTHNDFNAFTKQLINKFDGSDLLHCYDNDVFQKV